MQEVSVVLGSQSYDIHIGEGFLDQLEVLMQSFSFSKRGLLISDSNVALLYGDKLLNILNQNGFAFDLFVVHAGEQAKSFNIAAVRRSRRRRPSSAPRTVKSPPRSPLFSCST